LRQPGVVPALAYGPDGTWLVSGSNADGRLQTWDPATARAARKSRFPPGRPAS
jgi:WD40 repeat protein